MNLRERLINKKDTTGTKLYKIDDENLVVFVPPSERHVVENTKKYQAGDIEQHTMEANMVIHCVRKPVLDDAGVPCLDPDTAEYMYGDPVFSPEDRAFLESERHVIGGWLRLLKQELSNHIESLNDGVGKKGDGGGDSGNGKTG